jgi:hypothetical protein
VRPAPPLASRLGHALGRRWIALTTTLLVVVPALADLLPAAKTAPFHWMAIDTFYYLTIGRNLGRSGRFSCDGTRSTNGFHPLWQLVVGLTELVRERAGLGEIGLFLAVVASVLAVGGAVWLLGLTLLRARRLHPGFVLLPVGVYPLLVLPLWIFGLGLIERAHKPQWRLPVFGTPWSYMNGMESGLALLLFALSLFLITAPSATRSTKASVAVGAALAAFTLARLDHGLIAAPMLAGHALACLHRGRRREAASAIVAFVALLLPYLLINCVYFGAFVPLSGAAKTTFPHFNPEHAKLIGSLFHGKLKTSPWWLPNACREAQIVLPPLLALIYLLVRLARRRSRSRLDGALVFAAVGVISLGAHNFCFGLYLHQGYWYFPVSTLLPTLFLLAARPSRGRLRALRSPRLSRVSALACAAAAVLSLAFFARYHLHAEYNADLLRFHDKTVPEIKARYPQGLPPFIEVDDGVLSYWLDTPAQSFLLALDREGFEARREHRFVELCLSRGISHFASFQYRPQNYRPSTLSAWLGRAADQPPAPFVLEKEYVTSDELFSLMRVRSRTR